MATFIVGGFGLVQSALKVFANGHAEGEHRDPSFPFS